MRSIDIGRSACSRTQGGRLSSPSPQLSLVQNKSNASGTDFESVSSQANAPGGLINALERSQRKHQHRGSPRNVRRRQVGPWRPWWMRHHRRARCWRCYLALIRVSYSSSCRLPGRRCSDFATDESAGRGTQEIRRGRSGRNRRRVDGHLQADRQNVSQTNARDFQRSCRLCLRRGGRGGGTLLLSRRPEALH